MVTVPPAGRSKGSRLVQPVPVSPRVGLGAAVVPVTASPVIVPRPKGRTSPELDVEGGGIAGILDHDLEAQAVASVQPRCWLVDGLIQGEDGFSHRDQGSVLDLLRFQRQVDLRT